MGSSKYWLWQTPSNFQILIYSGQNGLIKLLIYNFSTLENVTALLIQFTRSLKINTSPTILLIFQHYCQITQLSSSS